jgi:hypothetical protein
MTAVPDLLVTLANGTQVPWTEFKTWSAIKQTHSIKGMSQETRVKMSVAAKRRQATPRTRIIIQQAKFRPIMTPTGLFPSKRAAADWAESHGLVNAHNKIQKWLKTHPDQFYYVAKDTK